MHAKAFDFMHSHPPTLTTQIIDNTSTDNVGLNAFEHLRNMTDNAKEQGNSSGKKAGA